MIVIHDLHELKRPLKDVVLTIGNFDGVHLGHREIFRRVVSRACACSGTSAVMTVITSYSIHYTKLYDGTDQSPLGRSSR